MKYLKMDGPYTDYGRPDMWDEESPIKCCVDTHTRDTECKPNEQVALLIEPRSIQRDVYLKMEKNYKNFKYVFTHDSKLLNNIPNAKPFIWGGVWCRCENPVKDKFMSILSSDKKYAELHRVRLRTALMFKDNGNVDVYGTCIGKRVDPIQTHEHYKYAVVVENYIDDLWITEKILNCFATKTIPIYLGSPKISEYFNPDGIIQVHDEQELQNTIKLMTKHVSYYNEMYNEDYVQEAINENFEKSKNFEGFEERFYSKYEKEIGEMLDAI